MSTLDAMITRERPKLVGAIAWMLGSWDEAEDAVQDASLNVYKALQRRPPESVHRPEAYLWRAAFNGARDVLRKRKRTRAPKVEPIGERVLVAEDLSPEKGAEKKEDVRVLREAMRSIRPSETEVLTLRVLEEMEWAQIATHMGCSVTTAKNIYSRAYKQLGQYFRNRGYDIKQPPVTANISRQA